VAADAFRADLVSGPFALRDGVEVMIRSIVPADERAMVRFHESLSDESVYRRYFHPLKLGFRVAHERLSRVCHPEPAREVVLVVERADLSDTAIIAVGRLTRTSGDRDAEFAIVVSDAAQGLGLGTELLERLVAAGRRAGLARITGEILPHNLAMQAVAHRVGFRCVFAGGEGLVRAELALERAERTKT
jgi:acetyltransferase